MAKKTSTTISENSQPDFDEEVIESAEPIVEPFDPSKIKVDREPMSIFQVMRKIQIGEIKLDPDFQRNLVWDIKRQSRLVESILLKIPLPAFYLDAVQPDGWRHDRVGTVRIFKDHDLGDPSSLGSWLAGLEDG